MALNYIEQSLNLASTVTGCILISALTFLFGIPIGTACSAVKLKFCGIIAVIKKYHQSIIKKKVKKYHKIVLVKKAK